MTSPNKVSNFPIEINSPSFNVRESYIEEVTVRLTRGEYILPIIDMGTNGNDMLFIENLNETNQVDLRRSLMTNIVENRFDPHLLGRLMGYVPDEFRNQIGNLLSHPSNLHAYTPFLNFLLINTAGFDGQGINSVLINIANEISAIEATPLVEALPTAPLEEIRERAEESINQSEREERRNLEDDAENHNRNRSNILNSWSISGLIRRSVTMVALGVTAYYASPIYMPIISGALRTIGEEIQRLPGSGETAPSLELTQSETRRATSRDVRLAFQNAFKVLARFWFPD